MKQSTFNKLIVDRVGNDTMAQYEFLNKFNKRILCDEPNWHMFKPEWSNKLEDGTYLTIRVGLSGIYTMLNNWNSKENKWDVGVADASYTIMYRDLTEKDFE